MTPTEANSAVFRRWIPVDRVRALLRGSLWLVPAAILVSISVPLWPVFRNESSAISNRLVTWSFALLLAPLPISGILCGFHAFRWLLLACWPARIGVFGNEDRIELRFGPFGFRSVEGARLEIRYPFERIGEDDEPTFEAYLPEEDQVARFLPRIRYPGMREPINQAILRYAKGSEPEIASALRPLLKQWHRPTDAAND